MFYYTLKNREKGSGRVRGHSPLELLVPLEIPRCGDQRSLGECDLYGDAVFDVTHLSLVSLGEPYLEARAVGTTGNEGVLGSTELAAQRLVADVGHGAEEVLATLLVLADEPGTDVAGLAALHVGAEITLVQFEGQCDTSRAFVGGLRRRVLVRVPVRQCTDGNEVFGHRRDVAVVRVAHRQTDLVVVAVFEDDAAANFAETDTVEVLADP